MLLDQTERTSQVSKPEIWGPNSWKKQGPQRTATQLLFPKMVAAELTSVPGISGSQPTWPRCGILCLEETLGHRGDSPSPFFRFQGFSLGPGPPPPHSQVTMETTIQENQVRQMEFPFRKAPLPGFHYSHMGPLASKLLWLH